MFYYDLAESLGYASVSGMLSTMTSAEVSEWGAYFDIKRQRKADGSLSETVAGQARAMSRRG